MAPSNGPRFLAGLFSSSNDRVGRQAVLQAGSIHKENGRSRTPSITGIASPVPRSDKMSEYIFDGSQLTPCDAPSPDLRELNESLEALAAIFPDVQIEVFRELLSNFSGDSRMAVVADALLKNQVGWVKGRWRKMDNMAKAADDAAVAALVTSAEQFRTEEYVMAVKNLAWTEFKGLSRSAINAVLAESNYSYMDARRTLVEMSSKSWRYTFSSFVYRRKANTVGEGDNHPLVVWKSSGHGSIVPSIRPTGNAELDKELFVQLVEPIQVRKRLEQVKADRAVAAALLMQEAEEHEQMHECCCCFTEAAFENFTSCTFKGHLICSRCVQSSLKEAVFGQGWQQNIDQAMGELRCPALDGDGCSGHISSQQVRRALLTGSQGEQMLVKLDQKLAEQNIISAGLLLIRCPFCDYAEIDDIYLTAEQGRIRPSTDLIVQGIFLSGILTLFPRVFRTILAILFFSTITYAVFAPSTLKNTILTAFNASISQRARSRRGNRFTCLSPTCRRTSCLSCHKSWVDIHICHESALVALRTQVEQAMSMAIKRVCPRCNTSFVKSAGCNKLTCPCGYKMCYVCRKDIGGDEGPDAGYRHYCEHFRPHGEPRPCDQCRKCNLWETEDEDKLLRQVKADVEQRWKMEEGRELSGAEAEFLGTGVAVKAKGGQVKKVAEVAADDAAGIWNHVRTLAQICDWIVEHCVA